MTKHRRISVAVSGICAVGAGILAASVAAGPENITFPEGYDKGMKYTTVDRHDIKQYRELWATPAALKAIQEGKPLPSGTVLTMVNYAAKADDKGDPVKDAGGRFVKGDLIGYVVMEKRTGWGAGYPAEWRNGEWEYAAFTKDKQPNAKSNAGIQACFVCHKPHEGQDYVFSYSAMKGTSAVTK